MNSPVTTTTPTPADERKIDPAPAPRTSGNGAAVTGAPQDGGERRDLQRAALHDLVVLLTESAAREAEIELRHRQSLEEGEKTFRRANRDLAAWRESERKALDERHDLEITAIQQQFDSDRDKATASHQVRLQRIQFDFDRTDSGIVQELKQAVWLAESVFDVSQNQAKAETKKARQAVAAKREEIAQHERQAEAKCRDYGEPLPPPEENKDKPAEMPATPESDGAGFEAKCEEVGRHLQRIRSLVLPHLFSGVTPWLGLFALVVIAGVVAQLIAGRGAANPFDPAVLDLRAIAIGCGATLLVGGVLCAVLKATGRRQVREAGAAFRQAVVEAQREAEARLRAVAQAEQAAIAKAEAKRDREIQHQRARMTPNRKRAQERYEAAVAAAEGEFSARLAELDAERDRARADADARYHKGVADLNAQFEADDRRLRENHQSQSADAQRRYEEGRRALERRWNERLAQIRAPIGGNGEAVTAAGPAPERWDDAAWRGWRPPQRFAPLVRFGELGVDLKRFAEAAPRNDEDGSGSTFRLPLPPPFVVPAALAFPRGASLLVQTDRAGRDLALRTLQMTMARLLTNLPPGRARFTIIDPVGLGQNFAGFMHLADYDEALVGSRIHTDAEQIEQRMRDLTDHMETVIQKYLRNEFETIDEYNAQAGELAEPYRFLVVADFPANFSPEAIRRLSSIAGTGARCGVYTLIARDTRLPIPNGAHLDDIEAHSVNLVQQGDQLVWKDDVFGMFPLSVDAPPDETALTRILHTVGQGAKEANRVEVPFETIAPRLPDQIWSRSATEELVVPVGRMGATRLQTLRLGRGVAQHALIAGKTGSGKSTLLHVLVTNLAAWYSPDEVEFYLIDFKKGVEFKTYATHGLPHARAIAVESDREFGLSVLQRLDAELGRRGELFRKAGVQDLPGYRQTTRSVMPRTLLMIDEFQEFFSEDDKLGQEAGLLLDRLVRQGRAFGIHVLLGSQTIGGSGLARSTIGQMAVRVALQTSEADSQLILGDNNSAARLLSRPGEAIYNDAGGSVEGNSPFQVSWLPDESRERYLSAVTDLARRRGRRDEPPIVFEGNAPADAAKNPRLADLLAAPAGAARATGGPVVAWLGEPVAIKEPTGVPLRRQSGANVLLVGQQEEAAMGILASAVVGLATQQPPESARFYVLDGSPADSPLAAVFPRVKAALPHDVKLIQWRGVEEAVNELAEEMERRRDGDQAGSAPSIYFLVYGLQRYRVLRKGEDEFSFSMSSSSGDDDTPKKPNPGKQFADLLREGPPVGIHVLVWCDTPIALERTLDRGSMREFDHRVLFQMSAADSSNLIDSPAANKLGFYRALSYSEEQGVMEKFRPYALPGQGWLDYVKAQLGGRVGVTSAPRDSRS